ncbi:MAG: glycosyltransferase family A protein [Bacteroidota bacterium]
MVSIILCTYNRAQLLPRTIRSVISQSYPHWQLIIIDDGSNDNTRHVVQQLQTKDKRILYHFQQNKGLAKARNAGLRKVKGAYICFVDSDDELSIDHLKKRVHYLTKNPSIDFIHGGMKLIGPKAKHYVVDLMNPKKKIHLSQCHIGGTFFFRKKVLLKISGFHPIPFGEDFDFYQRVEQYYSIKKVRFPTYMYHLDSENRLCDIFTETLMQ